MASPHRGGCLTCGTSVDVTVPHIFSTHRARRLLGRRLEPGRCWWPGRAEQVYEVRGETVLEE